MIKAVEDEGCEKIESEPYTKYKKPFEAILVFIIIIASYCLICRLIRSDSDTSFSGSGYTSTLPPTGEVLYGSNNTTLSKLAHHLFLDQDKVEEFKRQFWEKSSCVIS